MNCESFSYLYFAMPTIPHSCTYHGSLDKSAFWAWIGLQKQMSGRVRASKWSPFTTLLRLSDNLINIFDTRLNFICFSLCLGKGVRKGWGVDVKTPPWAWHFTKLYYLRKGVQLFSHAFSLLTCRLNANTAGWICMQISRNIANGPKSNN